MLDLLETFKTLQAAGMPSAFEAPCAKVIAQLAKPYCDEITIDKLGNVIAHKKGPGKKIMMPAHMDTIGFLVTHIEEKGFVRFCNIGGFAPYRLIGARVRFENGRRGCIALEKESDAAAKKLSEIKITDLYIDIGADGAESAPVQVGDVAVYDGEPRVLGEDRLVSPYCDDLIACAALLVAMSAIQKSVNDLYFVFTVQEEVGVRGAKTAAYAIEPDYGFCMDVTATGDMPGDDSHMQVFLGKGPAIKIKDSSLICNPQAVHALRAAAESCGIAYQNEILTGGGTDSSAMQISKAGVLSGCVSIPCRYIHSAGEMVSLQDVRQCARVIEAVAQMEL
ncbi:M20/M25/M40 family metallo-hydrolase [Acidaminobacterium chupaoyuni]